MPTPCVLTPTPLDPVCDFKASGLADVTIEVIPTDGSAIAIDAAGTTYSGGKITFLSTTQMKFTIVAGHSTLSLVCVFTDLNAAGTLNEVCPAHTLLDFLHGSVPAKLYNICA